VFLMTLQYFAVPEQYRQRVLFWGILGAIALRGIFIAGAASVVPYFPWAVYVFGAFLACTGITLLHQGGVHVEPRKNPVLRFFQGIIPLETACDSQKFFFRRQGKLMATVLVPVMIVVAATVIIFAAYSVPAILAVTQDPFIVYTSNIFALLGLRALFFLLAGTMGLFRYLQAGLCAGLMFLGGKLLISEYVHIPFEISVGVVAVILAGSVVASILFPAIGDMKARGREDGIAAPTLPAGEDAEKAKEEKRAA